MGIDEIGQQLCDIINQSITSATYPELWKRAKIVAAHKGGNQDDVNNYRPLSMLCIASKIIERHVHRSFMDYLHNRKLLCSKQSGFRTIYVMGQTPETVERLLKMDLKAVENWLIENQLMVYQKINNHAIM